MYHFGPQQLSLSERPDRGIPLYKVACIAEALDFQIWLMVCSDGAVFSQVAFETLPGGNDPLVTVKLCYELFKAS